MGKSGQFQLSANQTVHSYCSKTAFTVADTLALFVNDDTVA